MARKKGTPRPSSKGIRQPTAYSPGASETRKLEVVLKGDVAGTGEAVGSSLAEIQVPGVQLAIIQSGVGSISKSDVLMARTGSRLVIGFNVDVTPKLQQEIKEFGVEVRLYDTIYAITEDVKKIAGSLIVREPEEKITGRAEVIATFKGGRKGAIVGCEIREGTLEVGKLFRIITAMGPAYFGKITSLQVERQDVKIGKTGQQVGLKIMDWKKAKIGDLIECYETMQPQDGSPWRPRSGVFRFRS
ncbi:MAG: hypothetical protein JSW39_20365 [Desulfobacterales bacterium]|nr:MAG: hypothetical protein JSW39_20365 [Desulfobacterales bacterium]